MHFLFVWYEIWNKHVEHLLQGIVSTRKCNMKGPKQ